MAIIQLQLAAGREPVRGPSLPTPALTPNPAGQQIAIAGVTGAVAPVPVKKTARLLTGNVGVQTFHSQVELRELWQVGKIHSHTHGRTRRTERRKFIVNQRVRIESQPVPQIRNAVAEVKCRAPVP